MPKRWQAEQLQCCRCKIGLLEAERSRNSQTQKTMNNDPDKPLSFVEAILSAILIFGLMVGPVVWLGLLLLLIFSATWWGTPLGIVLFLASFFWFISGSDHDSTGNV